MPIPAIIAGGIMAAGAIGNYLNQKEKNEATQAMYDNLQENIGNVESLNKKDIQAYQNFMQRQYGSDAAKYSSALENFLNSPSYQNKDFNYEGNVEDYYDPAANQYRAEAMAELNRQAGNDGSIMSSDFYNRQAAKATAMASTQWKDAYDRMMQDRQAQLNAYNANSQNALNMYNADVAKQQYGINQYGTAKNNLAQGYSDSLMAGMNNRTAALQSQTNAVVGATNAANQQQSVLAQLAGPAAQFLGSYYGGGS